MVSRFRGVSSMSIKFSVISEWGEEVKVKLHDKPIVDKVCSRDWGFSDDTYPEFKNHYYIDHSLADGNIWLACQIFVVDLEFDGFVVDVELMYMYEGIKQKDVHFVDNDITSGNYPELPTGCCETRMGINCQARLDADMLQGIAYHTAEAEVILPQLYVQYKKLLQTRHNKRKELVA